MSTPAPLENFSEDKLNLKSFADDLTKIIMSPLPRPTNEYSKVIALDSGWGTGKTSFINMWINKLKTDSKLYPNSPKFICLPYNAWENDDSHDALIPILCSFQQLIDSDDEKKGLMTQLNDVIRKAISVSVSASAEMSILGLLTVNVAGNPEKKSPDTILEEFSARQEHKEGLKELIGSIRGEHDYLLICIDELDRCRPTFAIETLEVVKHFFDIPNVVFVFSLDRQQLSKSIKTIYGDIDSMGYLQRFFDYIIPLPKQELKSFLEDRLPQQYSYDIDLLSRLAKRFSISLRALNGICVAYRQFHGYINEKRDYLEGSLYGCNKVELYLLFIAMKYSHPEMYWSLLRNGSSDEPGREILGFIKDTSYWSEYTKERANLTGTNNYGEWKKMMNLFFLPDYDINYEDNRDEPIYKLIDESIDEIIEKSL